MWTSIPQEIAAFLLTVFVKQKSAKILTLLLLLRLPGVLSDAINTPKRSDLQISELFEHFVSQQLVANQAIRRCVLKNESRVKAGCQSLLTPRVLDRYRSDPIRLVRLINRLFDCWQNVSHHICGYPTGIVEKGVEGPRDPSGPKVYDRPRFFDIRKLGTFETTGPSVNRDPKLKLGPRIVDPNLGPRVQTGSRDFGTKRLRPDHKYTNKKSFLEKINAV